MKSMIQPPAVTGIHGPTPPRPSVAGTGAARQFDIFDIKQYFHIVLKRIWLVALCFFISVGVTMVFALQEEPVFRARATLLLSWGLPIPAALRQEEIQLRGEYLATQQLILQSGMMVSRAKERIARSGGKAGSYNDLRVYQVLATSFIALESDGPDPVYAAEFINALAEEYLDFKAEERMDTSQATVISLTQQANRILEELKKAEGRMVAFEKDNSVVALQDRGNVAASFLADLAHRSAGYRTERMLLETQRPLLTGVSDDIILNMLAWPSAAALQPAATGGTLKEGRERTGETEESTGRRERLIEWGVVDQPGWSALKRDRTRLEAQLTTYREKFRDSHPLIKQTLAKIEENQQALDVEVQFAMSQFNARLESLTLLEQSTQRVEKEWEADAIESTRKNQEYRALQRNAQRLQSLYDLVFNRLKEIDVSIGIEPETERIMEPAKPPTSPITTRKVQSIVIAALVGLGIGIGMVFGLEYIDDSLRYPEEVSKWLNLPFLGVVPTAKWDPQDLRTHMLANIDQKSVLAESYRNLRSAFLFSGSGDRARTLLLTSAVPQEGKTTTVLNLAVSLAQVGSRVLIVDGDLRRGELHKFFGLEGGRGLSDVLVGQAKPDAVIQRTGIPNLDFVATGPLPPNAAEIVLRPEMKSFMEYVRRTYDRVLFDCPPVMAVSEAVILASMVDAVIFVVWAGQTSRKLAGLAIQLLRERGATVLGCVLNNLEFGRVGYYYYSTYYGYYDYETAYSGVTAKPGSTPTAPNGSDLKGH
ncbi:MAG: polysaccharide biosynthesis tyrosine autokinase [Verrucomicrobia bacterium]|nr:polysaccharide biosynthesis tyrosine autokinase [Verrucomicrobiota bacterium]